MCCAIYMVLLCWSRPTVGLPQSIPYVWRLAAAGLSNRCTAHHRPRGVEDFLCVDFLSEIKQLPRARRNIRLAVVLCLVPCLLLQLRRTSMQTAHVTNARVLQPPAKLLQAPTVDTATPIRCTFSKSCWCDSWHHTLREAGLL